MTNKHAYTLEQSAFPFVKKNIAIDLVKNKVKIKQKSLFKSDEIDFDISRINPNPQKIKRMALLWLLMSCFLTAYFLFCTSYLYWVSPLAPGHFEFSILRLGLTFLSACYSIWSFFNKSYHLILFFDLYNNSVAFGLLANKPNKESCDEFVDTLKKTIVSHEQTRSIQTILKDIPTHILVEEFSSSYIDELSKRGIDVGALLSFMQKRITNMQDAANRPPL